MAVADSVTVAEAAMRVVNHVAMTVATVAARRKCVAKTKMQPTRKRSLREILKATQTI